MSNFENKTIPNDRKTRKTYEISLFRIKRLSWIKYIFNDIVVLWNFAWKKIRARTVRSEIDDKSIQMTDKHHLIYKHFCIQIFCHIKWKILDRDPSHLYVEKKSGLCKRLNVRFFFPFVGHLIYVFVQLFRGSFIRFLCGLNIFEVYFYPLLQNQHI